MKEYVPVYFRSTFLKIFALDISMCNCDLQGQGYDL